jgi:type III secretion protein Q
MTTVDAESITPLVQHPALLKVAPELSALTRQLYGQDWSTLAVASDTFKLSFGEVHIKQADMQLRVRCGGQDYELQVVQPSTFADFQGALSPTVPVPVQRAAVLHVLAPLWQALEQRFLMPVELVDLQVGVPAWPAAQALGLHVTREGPQASQHTVVLLRTDSAHAWPLLGRAALLPSTASVAVDALLLKVSAYAEPIGLTLTELSQLEPGDVLVMDAAADQRDQLAVRLMLHGRALDGMRASLHGTQLVIDHAPNPATASPSGLPANPSLPHMNNPIMNNDTTMPTVTAQPIANLDSVKVDIDLELARMTVPLSALRTLSVGQVFDTQHPINSQSVVLWCGGQRLGVGQLVALGDRLGVRVAALEPSAAASVSASVTV